MNQVPNPLIPCIFIYSISSITGRNKNPHAFILYTYITPTTFHQLGGLLWTFHPTTIFLPPTQATHTRGHHRGEFVQFLQGTHLKRWNMMSQQWVNQSSPPQEFEDRGDKIPPQKNMWVATPPWVFGWFFGDKRSPGLGWNKSFTMVDNLKSGKCLQAPNGVLFFWWSVPTRFYLNNKPHSNLHGSWIWEKIEGMPPGPDPNWWKNSRCKYVAMLLREC